MAYGGSSLPGAFGDNAAERDELVPIAVVRARASGVEFVTPTHVVVIGDTPLDVQCASISGAMSIAVANRFIDEATLADRGASAAAALRDLSGEHVFL